MKRLCVLFLATALAVILSAGMVCAQTFSNANMKFTVPSGWYASENDSGIVTLINGSNASDFIMLRLFYVGGCTLQFVAESAYEGMGGIGGLTHDAEGLYSFLIKYPSGVYLMASLLDNSLDSGIPWGYCFMSFVPISSAGSTAAEVLWNNIYNTMIFSPDPVEGSMQTFSRMNVFVPDGWTPEETDGGKSVALYQDTDREAYIKIDVDTTDGKSLEEIANSLCAANNGSGLQRASSGYYGFYFTNASGVKVAVFVDNSATDSRVPSGYYLVQSASSKTNLYVFSKVLSSFTITVGDTDGNEPGRRDFGANEANINAKSNTVNNYAVTDIINNNDWDNSGSQDNQVDDEQPSSSGSSGGCSAGFGSLALLVLCTAFIVRKSR